MYRVSGKQILILAFLSALIGGVIVACAQKAIDTGRAVIETPVVADPSVASDEQNNIEIYKKVGPGVVNITSRTLVEGWFGVFPNEGTGSGSIIDDQGHILTNYHVIKGATQLEVQIESEKYTGTMVGADPDNDLAVIKVNAPKQHLTAIKLGSSEGLQVGQKVLAIGNPFGLQRTLTTGIISGLERPLRDAASRRTIEGAIQTDASINPGNSGGPLLNARGEMIGINTAIFSPSGGSVGIGFAVPVNTAAKIIPDLIARGHVPRPWLGISTIHLTRRIARAFSVPVESGVIVANVQRGTGAAAAGLRGSVVSESLFGGGVIERIGDVIVAIDNKEIKAPQDIGEALKNRKPGDVVQVVVLRQGQRVTVAIQLSDRPLSAG